MKFGKLAGSLALAFTMAVAAIGPVHAAPPVATKPAHKTTLFNTILKDGKINANPNSSQHQQIKWQQNDALIRSYKMVRQRCIEMIECDADLQALLDKPTWAREDCRFWERNLCNLIAREVHKMPGLDRYRDISYQDPLKKARIRQNVLNDLSKDIENGTYIYEFDCEAQSVFKGCLAQELENHFLPPYNVQTYKSAGNYYLVVGYCNLVQTPDQINLHAFILTPSSAIFESTANPSQKYFYPYYTPSDPTFTVKKFREGKPLVSSFGSIFGFNLTQNQAQEIRALALHH